MRDSFARIATPEDFIRVSDTAYRCAFERAANFELRARHFNDNEWRTRSRDKETLLRLRRDVATEIATYHAFFTEQLRHFLPDDPHCIPSQDKPGIRAGFELTVMWDIGRAHMLKACAEMDIIDYVTRELLTAVGRKVKTIDGEAVSPHMAYLNARIQAAKIIEMARRIREVTHYTPDEAIMGLVRNDDLRPVLLGEGVSADDFIEMTSTIPLNSPSSARSLEWT